MIQAFYSGISGLKASQTAIDVTSDNLANINTVGFKGSSVEFSSFFVDSIDRSSSAYSSDAGAGVQIQTSALNLAQGSLIKGDRDTELAIDGNGWFGVQGEGNIEFTRNGSFNFDAARDLVTDDKAHVLGTLGNNITDGVLTEVLGTVPLGDVNKQEPLNFPETLHFPVQPTQNVSFDGNIGTDDRLINTSAKAISSKDEDNTLKLSFTQVSPKPTSGTKWDIIATITGVDGTTVFDTQNGIATFADNGGLTSFSIPPLNNDGTDVSVNLGQGFEGLIAIDTQAVSVSSSSDGLEAGDLVGYTIDGNANVIAGFSNGRASSVGKVALFHFQNEQGLEKLSGSRFTESSNSGKAIFYTDAEGNNINHSTVLNYRLENSNVRTEVGLTELIIMQRAYDANSKTVSTSDQMIQKALQMDA